MSKISQKYHWAMALSVDGIGRQTVLKIEKYLNKNRISWSEFWVAENQDLWQKLLNKNIVKKLKIFINEHNIYSFKNLLKKQQISVVSYKDAEYPQALKQLTDFPLVLFVKGSLKLNPQLSVAVIGTRQMTAYGRFVTRKITTELVNLGATIVSGFMYGVDVTAQEQAVKRRGQTIGVLGYGFNHVYPRSHQEIMQDMLQTGRASFISEYPPDTQASRGTFPARNRLIAALSRAVLVTEAAEKSGTQITVRCALDYGKEIFAVPGPISSQYSEGLKMMHNQGATMVSSGQEILQHLSYGVQQQQLLQPEKKLQLNLSRDEAWVYQQLVNQPLSVDQLFALSKNYTLPQICQLLSALECKALIEMQAGQWFIT